MSETHVWGALELGGTKCIGALCDQNGRIVERIKVPTATPHATLEPIIELLASKGSLQGIGVGSFGPLDLDEANESYGALLNTSKTAWIDFPIVSHLKRALSVPVSIASDVEAAAIGESRFGAGQGQAVLAYLTVGTGIGCGLVSGGKLLRGSGHPEIGHYFPARHPLDLGFEGICPYHRDCIEGLASGPAIRARFDASAETLDEDLWIWDAIGDYIAQLLLILDGLFNPQVIVLGGGVLQRDHLIPRIRKAFIERRANYGRALNVEEVDRLIVPAACSEPPAVLGAYVLARESS